MSDFQWLMGKISDEAESIMLAFNGDNALEVFEKLALLFDTSARMLSKEVEEEVLKILKPLGKERSRELAIQISDSANGELLRMFRTALNDAQRLMISNSSDFESSKHRYRDIIGKQSLGACYTRKGQRLTIRGYPTYILSGAVKKATGAVEMDSVLRQGDLLLISSHNSVCPICLPYEGKVFSVSGTHPRFPPLESLGELLYGGVFSPHPNCLHRMLPYSEDGKSEEELRYAASPVQMTEKQYEMIKKAEREASDNVRTGRHFRKYASMRSVIGRSFQYKTFHGFMRGLRAKSERYLAMEEAYRNKMHSM